MRWSEFFFLKKFARWSPRDRACQMLWRAWPLSPFGHTCWSHEVRKSDSGVTMQCGSWPSTKWSGTTGNPANPWSTGLVWGRSWAGVSQKEKEGMGLLQHILGNPERSDQFWGHDKLWTGYPCSREGNPIFSSIHSLDSSWGQKSGPHEWRLSCLCRRWVRYDIRSA